ncbi:MAG: MBOAT family O-acyltransferase [Bdellovibrionia bacterium]
MTFISLSYLTFFPLVVAIYFLLPYQRRWIWLLGMSCYFYMAFIPVYILALFFTIAVDYVAGILIEREARPSRRKYLLGASIVANCAVLFVFKYYDFFGASLMALTQAIGWNYSIEALEIILPIGLSFHTFQAMSYTIEVYRGRQPAEKHLGIYALYVMFFPQLVAGPIERPQNLLHQFRERHDFDSDAAVSGLRLILWGVFKKVVIADRLALFVDRVYSTSGVQPSAYLISATVFFAFQIYCDFSAYSDIARGSARVMGFKLMTNFKYPYFAGSVTEFWRRWHISLSTWFRDYVYVPLGGKQVSFWIRMRNLLVVFLISGLWHGANLTFVIWGALHFIFVGSEAYFGLTTGDKSPAGLRGFARVLYTFTAVTIAWVFFRAKDVHEALNILFEMTQVSHGQIPIFFLDPDLHKCAAAVFTVVALEYVWSRWDIESFIFQLPRPVRWAGYYVMIAAIFAAGVFDNKSFIYFQF